MYKRQFYALLEFEALSSAIEEQAMQVFEQVFILMNPPEGPNNSTITLVLYLYRSGFQNFKQGYASAIAWVLFIVIFGLTLIQFQRQRQSSIYES